MGLEIAKQAYIRGYDVTLVVANVSVRIPSLFNVIKVETASQMNREVLKLIPSQDIFISSAAVSDFEFEKKSNQKIDSSCSLFLNLKPTNKIIRKIKKINPDIFLVGFKAEFNISTEDMINRARRQITDTCADLVVANDISKKGCNFGSDSNEVLIVGREIHSIPLASKSHVAKVIFDVIEENTYISHSY